LLSVHPPFWDTEHLDGDIPFPPKKRRYRSSL
jgi:hypothetical protein